MKNLKPLSIEWLEFARSIGATHWHTKGNFYKINSGQRLIIYTQNGWAPSFYDPELLNDRDIFFKIDFSQLGNKPSEPDWTTAPEGATHWIPENNEYYAGWYKESFGQWRRWSEASNAWREPIPGFIGSDRHESLIKRPTVNQQMTVPVVKESLTTEWNGTGLPPVGTVCEFRKNPDEWINGTVFGHRHCNNGDVEVFIDLIHSFDYSSNLSRFRPIRSERERWVDTALGVRKAGAYTDEQWAADLYDAGLAKLPD